MKIAQIDTTPLTPEQAEELADEEGMVTADIVVSQDDFQAYIHLGPEELEDWLAGKVLGDEMYPAGCNYTITKVFDNSYLGIRVRTFFEVA